MRKLSLCISELLLALALASCHDAAGPDRAILALSTTSHDFGEIEVGQPSEAFVLTVSNGGQSPTAQLSARFSSLTGQFRLTPDQCSGQVLAPGGSCQVHVSLMTGAPGPAEVVLTVSAPGNDSASATFRGIGIVHRIALVNEAVGDLGQVVLGVEGPPQTLTVANRGTVPTAALSVLLTGPDSADFEIASDLCSGRRLSPEETCAVEIQFDPTLGGTKEAYAWIVGSPREIAQAHLTAVVSTSGAAGRLR